MIRLCSVNLYLRKACLHADEVLAMQPSKFPQIAVQLSAPGQIVVELRHVEPPAVDTVLSGARGSLRGWLFKRGTVAPTRCIVRLET